MERYRFTIADGELLRARGRGGIRQLAGCGKRMRYRSPRNCRKTTLGTAVGFRCTIRAAMNSRGCRSASKERSRSRKPLGGTRTKRSENRTPCRGGGPPDTSTAWLGRLDGGHPKDSASAQLCTAVVSVPIGRPGWGVVDARLYGDIHDGCPASPEQAPQKRVQDRPRPWPLRLAIMRRYATPAFASWAICRGGICLFYETPQDLLDTAACYFEAGLKSTELCVWAVSDPISQQQAEDALRREIPGFDRYRGAG